MFKDIDIEKLDVLMTEKMNHYGIIFLRYSVAVIFIWFGLLKTCFKQSDQVISL